MSSNPSIDIRSDHWELVTHILKKHIPDRDVWAFGSRAKWTAKPYSDLDLAIKGDQPLTLSVSAALEDDFNDSVLPWKVDLVDWMTATPSFRKVIDRDKVLIQQRQPYNAPKWPIVRIETIAEKITIGPFGSRMKSDTYVPTGVPVIRGMNLTGGRRFSGDWVYIPEEKADELASCNVVANDLVFPHRGAIGEVGLVPADRDRYMLSSSLMMLRCNKQLADPLYLLYFFKSATGQHELLKNASQVGTPGIGQPLSSLKSIELALPSLKEQRAIARILGVLDDKIELNRRMNATLKAMARALFQSWFVDFDPVHAKLEGRRPAGMDEDTAALFPAAFGNSELGTTPAGWHVRPVGAAIDCVGGGTPDTKISAFWQPEEHAWSTPKDLSSLQSPVLLRTERKLSSEGLTKVSSGLLPEGTLLLSSRAPIGYLAIAQMPIAVNQGYIAMIPGGLLPPLFMLFWCQQNMGVIKSHANGSTFMEISKKAFRPLPALIPSSEVLIAFLKLAEPFFAKLVANEKQSHTLGALRDTLLPKLISGELRILDAAKRGGEKI